MYEKDGESYFVVDSHMHYWNAAPDNWVAGQENYAKGWIECFHAYQALGEEPGFYDAAEFEENMSTHYGRMIHEDDRTIMFANPEDAAAYIGFDLPTR